MKQILIVEDDSLLNKMLTYNLTADGYSVTSVLNARTAADTLARQKFDLVLLDINLPDGNGYDLCRLIKPDQPDTIVIFLTANDQESDQIRGYEAGAVDYITKPFVLGSLQRKIKAMLSMLEHHRTTKDVYDDGRLVLDFSEQSATLNGTPVNLSAMEYRMLNLFRKNPRQVLTRGLLLEKLWDVDEKYVDEHTLTTTISRIRSKIESDGGAPYIKTVYGMGYQWTGGEAKVSDISHQVKTPVSNLKMVTDTLLTYPVSDAERTDFVRGIRSQTDKLDFLFQALVKTSRLETGVIRLEKKACRLFDTVAQAMSGIVYAAEKKEIAVSVDCPEHLTLSHDSKWTTEALFNLLDNAVKYTPSRGKITVSVVPWEMYVEIKVSDTGKGISESNHAAIFRRFYREEEIHEQQGVGIGLYLARQIVMQQGGYIKVVSVPGQGSDFSIMLPVR